MYDALFLHTHDPLSLNLFIYVPFQRRIQPCNDLLSYTLVFLLLRTNLHLSGMKHVCLRERYRNNDVLTLKRGKYDFSRDPICSRPQLKQSSMLYSAKLFSSFKFKWNSIVIHMTDGCEYYLLVLSISCFCGV